jgi:hypothetical protein
VNTKTHHAPDSNLRLPSSPPLPSLRTAPEGSPTLSSSLTGSQDRSGAMRSAVTRLFHSSPQSRIRWVDCPLPLVSAVTRQPESLVSGGMRQRDFVIRLRKRVDWSSRCHFAAWIFDYDLASLRHVLPDCWLLYVDMWTAPRLSCWSWPMRSPLTPRLVTPSASRSLSRWRRQKPWRWRHLLRKR